MIWKFRWHILHNTAGQGSEGSWRSPHLLCRCLEKDRPGVPPGAATPGVPQPPAHPCTHTVPGQHPPSLCFLPPVACRSSWGRGVQWEGPTFLQYLSCQILPALDIHHVIQSPLHSYEVDSISVLWMRKLKLRRIKEFAQVTQIVRREAGVGTKVCFTPKPISFLLKPHSCSLRARYTGLHRDTS